MIINKNLFKILINLIFVSGVLCSIKHYEFYEAHLVEVGDKNYAIKAPSFIPSNFVTAYVNGNDFVLMNVYCTSFVNCPECISTVERARSQLKALDSPNPQFSLDNQVFDRPINYGVSSYSLVPGSDSMEFKRGNLKVSVYANNGLSQISTDSNRYSITREGLLYDLSRIFVHNDAVTYVYNNGTVTMRPLQCVSQEESEYIRQLKFEVQQMEFDEQRGKI